MSFCSGVLAESLTRSRNKWISDGYFEKYWTKPHKRKGVINEDPKNPPKDSMTKVGTVSITIEPHVIEATMYTVKDKTKPVVPQNQAATPARPIIQYGPPNGMMPPRPPPAVTQSPAAAPALAQAPAPVSVPAPATATATAQAITQAPQAATSSLQAPSPSPTDANVPTRDQGRHITQAQANTAVQSTQIAAQQAVPSTAPSYPPRPTAPSALAAPQQQPPAPGALPIATQQTQLQARPVTNIPPQPATGPQAPLMNSPAPSPSIPGPSTTSPHPGQAKPSPLSGPATPAAKPTTNDPVIALLAQRASTDPELRDLMKRVAVGQAKGGELAHFQKIIDQLNIEYKKSGGQQGPSADRLMVDGRTVKYFADEVRTILEIVLTSNPNQKSADLRPPPRSDPLVVLLVKTALEDTRTRNMIKRIAEGRPSFTDATDLKEIIDKLHRDSKATPKPIQTKAVPPGVNALTNGQIRPVASPSATHPNAQALRSKGPPPTPKPDVSAVVFDFGTGDRYLFPKFSILEYLPTSSGQQLVASFLIVRKGSNSEYGGNPQLDYYEPVTIRIYTPTGRHLENFTRVVAPQDEVRRYMDDVMDNMTRAEYVLLAMRLPRVSKVEEKDDTVTVANDEPKTSTITPVPNAGADNSSARPPVLWTHQASTTKSSDISTSYKARDPEQESQARYQRLINSVAAKDVEAV